jgi:hypothetical protein
MGIALLLTGFGFLILTLGGALAPKPVAKTAQPTQHSVAATT